MITQLDTTTPTLRDEFLAMFPYPGDCAFMELPSEWRAFINMLVMYGAGEYAHNRHVLLSGNAPKDESDDACPF